MLGKIRQTIHNTMGLIAGKLKRFIIDESTGSTVVVYCRDCKKLIPVLNDSGPQPHQHFVDRGIQDVAGNQIPVNVTDEDMLKLDHFALHERCLQEGICPNCYSRMDVKSFNEKVCPKCRFRHYNANPERMPHATE